jgi:hypothetical protein
MKTTSASVLAVLTVGVVIGYVVAKATGDGSSLLSQERIVSAVTALVASTAHAADAPKPSPQAANYSRTGTVENRAVYYPGTEALEPDEMRVIACGSGMPVPSLNQGAACFLVELGNGDKFVFDMGTGSSERLMSLGIPLDYINKVFIGHLHMDHMGDLPAFWLYGPQNNRSGGINVWGPGGGGTNPEWGMKASMEHLRGVWAWMQGTLAGTIDTRAWDLNVNEFDWSKVNNVIYEENGVVIRTIPAIHFEQSVSFILEWNGLKLSYSSDTQGLGPLDSRSVLPHADVGQVLRLQRSGGAQREHTDSHLRPDVRQDHVDDETTPGSCVSLHEHPRHTFPDGGSSS